MPLGFWQPSLSWCQAASVLLPVSVPSRLVGKAAQLRLPDPQTMAPTVSRQMQKAEAALLALNISSPPPTQTWAPASRAKEASFQQAQGLVC